MPSAAGSSLGLIGLPGGTDTQKFRSFRSEEPSFTDLNFERLLIIRLHLHRVEIDGIRVQKRLCTGGYVGSSEVKIEDLEPSAATTHFKTDHLLRDIGTRAISAGFVTIGAQGAKFLLSFLAAAVLSRLLNPKDFGLVGMVLGFTGLVAVFAELGLSTATVQRENITQEQVSNLFWINVGFGGTLALICTLTAPLVARFYRDPHVSNIMLALSGIFLLTGSHRPTPSASHPADALPGDSHY